MNTAKPIVCTIAGSDSGGGAGIQADLLTFHDLATYGCSVITAVTAQNSFQVTGIENLSAEMIAAQLHAINDDFAPRAIKLGMLTAEAIPIIHQFLTNYGGYTICDPVMISTSGARLLPEQATQEIVEKIFPLVDLITPNISEAEFLLNRKITSTNDIESAAKELLKYTPAVLLKGGHFPGDFSQDFFCDQQQSFWLNIEKQPHIHNHGSGCSLSAAITACLGLGYDLTSSLVIAKAYVSQGIRLATAYGQGPGPIAHAGWPHHPADLPWISQHAEQNQLQFTFPACPENIGLYPIVNSSTQLKKVLTMDIKTIQLRIKNQPQAIIEQEIKTCIALTQQYQAQLFINDYWQLAIEYGAYGVHLGQQDLQTAHLSQIAKAGLRLGVSNHNYFELACAHAFRPSYISIGPIYPSQNKPEKNAVGIDFLKQSRLLLNCPLIAIGGIEQQNLSVVKAAGADGWAVINSLNEVLDFYQKS